MDEPHSYASYLNERIPLAVLSNFESMPELSLFSLSKLDLLFTFNYSIVINLKLKTQRYSGFHLHFHLHNALVGDDY